MEVHHHAHHGHGKKSWKAYFWEFLMLFLAVFCGFIAENQREHMVEHAREKKYMRSLLADLKEDTAELSNSIRKAVNARRYQDSLHIYLYQHPPISFISDHFVNVISLYALLRLNVTFNEVTEQQLRNAGNLRLIRSEQVIRKVSIYWKEQENTLMALERYLIYRNRARELEEKLYAFSDVDLVLLGIVPEKPEGVKILQADPLLWTEYRNVVSHCEITTEQYRDDLIDQLGRARELIQLLKKEYHLD